CLLSYRMTCATSIETSVCPYQIFLRLSAQHQRPGGRPGRRTGGRVRRSDRAARPGLGRRAGDAVPRLGEDVQLLGGEVAQEVAAHALEVGDLRLEQPVQAGVGQAGVRAAGVVGAREALHEPVALEAV